MIIIHARSKLFKILTHSQVYTYFLMYLLNMLKEVLNPSKHSVARVQNCPVVAHHFHSELLDKNGYVTI